MGNLVQIFAVAAIAWTSVAAGEISPGKSGRQLSQAEQPAEAAPEAPPAASREGTPATVIDNQQIEGIIGKSVRSSADEDMGRVIDVLVNRTGQVRGVVIDFGGFLGVGSRKVAVDWSALHFPDSRKSNNITLDLTRDQVRVAPEYRPGVPVVILRTPEAQPTTNAMSPGSDKQ
jgi:PRC-barrel domain